jgi:hypothetical protein
MRKTAISKGSSLAIGSGGDPYLATEDTTEVATVRKSDF